MSFANTHPGLVRALSERGYDVATPVQRAVLDSDAAGRDLLVSAQTGSGKTVAYGLAMAPAVLGEAERFGPSQAPLGLVVAPTRELALQVQGELTWLYRDAGARVVACVGGMDIRREQRELLRGAHLVAGTPGRLCDHLDRGDLDLSKLRAVVLDEADEMLDLGFREDLERILDRTPSERRTFLFSATLPKAIVAIAQRYQRAAKRIASSPEDVPHGDIEYRAFHIVPHERDHAVINVLRYYDARSAIVFCATRDAVKHLHAHLVERGFSAVALSGELTQAERSRALQTLRASRASVCVATDVAARGLDVPELGLVVHADAPRDGQTLLHRSGRTARAGRKGTCVLLVSRPARRRVEQLFAAARIDAAWSSPPTPEAIRERDRKRLVDEVAELAASGGDEDREAARQLLSEQSAEALAVALVRLHGQRLPAPEELSASRELASDGASSPGRGHDDVGASVWFRLNVGRQRNADPRWIIPLLCRRGGVTKRDIGSIRILPRETRFEIATAAADRFADAVRHSDPKEPGIRIDLLEGVPERTGHGRPTGAREKHDLNGTRKHRGKAAKGASRSNRGDMPPRRKR